jgi:hypothetical protein
MAVTITTANVLERTTSLGGFPSEGPITLACWARITSSAAFSQVIAITHSPAPNDGQDYIGFNGPGATMDFGAYNGNTGQFRTITGVAFSLNTWSHFAMTWNNTGGVVNAYINGANVGSGSGAITARTTITSVEIGPLAGQVQDVVIYTAELSAGEIAQLARSRQPIRRSGLQAWYPFRALDLQDYSGKALTLSDPGGIASAGTSNPPAGWGAPLGTILLPASGPTPGTADPGLVRVAGAATPTTESAGSPGLVRVAGGAVPTAGASGSPGLVRVGGSAASAVVASIASGRVLVGGSAIPDGAPPPPVGGGAGGGGFRRRVITATRRKIR